MWGVHESNQVSAVLCGVAEVFMVGGMMCEGQDGQINDRVGSAECTFESAIGDLETHRRCSSPLWGVRGGD